MSTTECLEIQVNLREREWANERINKYEIRRIWRYFEMSKPTSAFLYYTNVSWWTKRRKKTPCKYIRIQKMLATLIDVVEMEIFFQMVGKLHFRRLICARQITYWIIFHHSKQASLVCVCICACVWKWYVSVIR